MTSPGGIGPERLAEIVDGAAPRDDEERALLALMEETRALEPGASPQLRRRVLEGPPPQPALARLDPRRWLAPGERRRALSVAVPALAAVAIALVVAIPALDGGSSSPAEAPPKDLALESAPPAAAGPEGARERADSESLGAAPPAPEATTNVAPGARPPGSDPGRAQQVTAATRVQVASVSALSRASASAMGTVRRLGGFTASSDYSVPSGAEGVNRLVFRVPVATAGDAVAAFGRLGVVTGQSANIVDLTARLDTATTRIDRLGARIAELRALLAARPGDPALTAELARAGAALRAAEAVRDTTLRRTRLATLRLTLTTEGPPAPVAEEGRFWGPISRAGGRLADATAWILGALVLVGPFLLLAGVAGLAAQRLRGRSARRLMGSV